MFWCSNVSELSRILKGLDCCFDPGCFKSRNNLICVETTFQCYKNSQVLVSWFKLVYFSSQSSSQLRYPRILKANDGSFALLHNDKGARFGVDIDVPPPEGKHRGGTIKIHSHLVLYYRDLPGNKMGTLIYHAPPITTTIRLCSAMLVKLKHHYYYETIETSKNLQRINYLCTVIGAATLA